MTVGAPRSAYAGGEFIAVRREAVCALGSWEAAGVWQRICWRAERTGHWVATIREVAEDCCLSEHKAKAALAVIREAGWVTATRASGADRTLRWEPVWAEEANGESPLYVEGDFPSTPISKTVETPPTPTDDGALFAAPTAEEVSSKPDPMAGFDDWYARYPRKVAKGDARKAWAQVIRGGATPAAIMDGLRRQWQHLRDQHTRGFCPYPASWLRAERWTDEAPTTPPDNVHPIRPETAWVGEDGQAVYLPPPKTDAFA